MNNAQFVLENAEIKPQKVADRLSDLHRRGETVSDILEFVTELESRKVSVPSLGKPCFDICGTGGSGKSRINLSTALAVKLSQPPSIPPCQGGRSFCIAKHGNKAASGRVGGFDVLGNLNLEIGDTPAKVSDQLQQSNLSFVFAPAFHPALKPLAPIRASLGHPSIFNYLGPLLNPVENLTAQMIGVSKIEVGEKLAQVCLQLGKNVLLVHDTVFGLDDVSIGGVTKYWRVGGGRIERAQFHPTDFGLTAVEDFNEIAGGDAGQNAQIFQDLLTGKAPQAQQQFLQINYEVAQEFFSQFLIN